MIDAALQESGWGGYEELASENWRDVQPVFEEAHFINGFAWPDGKFRFRANWQDVPFGGAPVGPWQEMPSLPDHWEAIESADEAHPFRLATSPARSFLNSTFNETPGSMQREKRPTLLIHPLDAEGLGIEDGGKIVVGNARGEVRLHAEHFNGVQRGVVISEGVFPNHAFVDGKGINSLTGSDTPAPYGGSAFHDNKVWVRPR